MLKLKQRIAELENLANVDLRNFHEKHQILKKQISVLTKENARLVEHAKVSRPE
jgi:hypothetical protein